MLVLQALDDKHMMGREVHPCWSKSKIREYFNVILERLSRDVESVGSEQTELHKETQICLEDDQSKVNWNCIK